MKKATVEAKEEAGRRELQMRIDSLDRKGPG